MLATKKLAIAALAGLICSTSLPIGVANASDTSAGEAKIAVMQDAKEKHACKGMNSCKGNSPDGKNSCKGKSECSTMDKSKSESAKEKHACKGHNSCKGNSPDGKNSCKGKSACATDGSKDKE